MLPSTYAAETAETTGQLPLAGTGAPGKVLRLPGWLKGVSALGALNAACVLVAVYGPDAGIPRFETYKAMLYLHIAAVVVTFGSTFAVPIIQPMAARQGVRTLRFALQFCEQLETRIVTPGSWVW